MRSARECFLAAYETPRFARLAPNLHAACFPLMKLLPARFMLDRAEASGKLAAGSHIAETTSGTFGLSLAMLAAVRGYELSLVSASSLIDDGLRRRLEFLGARVMIVEDLEGSGNQQGRLDRLNAVIDERPGTFWPNQYDNADNPLAYGRLAELIVRSLDRVDYLIGCVGSGGSLCGTGRFLHEIFPDMRIVAIDTNRSVLFGHRAGRRLLRGLGNSIMPGNLNHELIDEVHWVGALPAFAAARALYRDHALFMGPTSGAAALVGQWIARTHSDMVIVIILPDEGHRYQNTLYDDAWLAQLDGWPIEMPREPLSLDHIEEKGDCQWTRFSWQRRRYRSE